MSLAGVPALFGPVSFAWWDYLLVCGFSIGIAALIYNLMNGRFDDHTRLATATIAGLVLSFALPSLCFAVGYTLPHPYRHTLAMDALGKTAFTLRETDGPGRYRFRVTDRSNAPGFDLPHARRNDCFGVEGIQFPGGLALYDEYRTACPTRISRR